MPVSRPLLRQEGIALASASGMTVLIGFQVYVQNLLRDGSGGMS